MSVHDVRARLDEALRSARPEALDRIAEQGARMAGILRANGAARHSEIMQYAVDRLVLDRIPEYLLTAFNLKVAPPTIDEFLDDEQFWKKRMNIWPLLRPEITLANPYPFLTREPVSQWIAGGGTGTGKTATAHTTQAYHLTLLHCMRDPHGLYGLTSATPLEFMFMGPNERVTRDVLFRPFRNMVTAMPWMQRETTWDRNNESQLIFSNMIQVGFGLPDVQTIVGSAMVSAIGDEVNFMQIVEQSKKVAGNRGKGGRFDQAQTIVTEMVQRRESRAVGPGPLPGVICVMSSTRYKNDFIDRRQAQVRLAEEGDKPEKGVRLFRARRFDVQPQDRFGGPDWRKTNAMRILVGSERAATRILRDDEVPGKDYYESSTVELVPETFRASFTNGPEDALRNILGIATDAISAFIGQRHKVSESFARGQDIGLRSFLVNDNVDYQREGLPDVVREYLPKDLEARRFVHVDLSTSSDRCGIAMVRIAGSTIVSTDDSGEGAIFETVPHLVVEMACSIKPSPSKELDPADVRMWLLRLKNYYGINIYQVSYDGYKSDESIRQFRKAGVRSKLISVDLTREPYEHLRRTLYQDRCDMVENDILRDELVQLERVETGKPEINHPPSGSKDIADAVAGAVFGAAMARSSREAFDVTDEAGQNLRDKVPVASRRRDPVRR